MSCNSCGQTTKNCSCSSAVATTVVEPEGVAPCAPGTGPCDPNPCCGAYDKTSEGSPNFIYTAAGPVCLPEVDSNNDCSEGGCTNPPCPPIYIPDSGALSAVICFDLAPGTYEVSFRAEVGNLAPGAQIIALYRPDCSTDEGEIVISKHKVSCAEDNFVAFTIFDEIAVFVPGCRPGVRLLYAPGCFKQSLAGTGTDGPCGQDVPFIQNVQFGFERVKSSDIVSCNGGPLVTEQFDDCNEPLVVTGFTTPDADDCTTTCNPVVIQFNRGLLPSAAGLSPVPAGGITVFNTDNLVVAVQGTVSLSADGKTATFVPDGGCFDNCASYKVIVSSTLTDCCGQALSGGVGLVPSECFNQPGATCYAFFFDTCTSITPPDITTSNPEDGSNCAPVGTSVLAVFDSNVTLVSSFLEPVGPGDCAGASNPQTGGAAFLVAGAPAGQMRVQGLTGMTAASVGNLLTISGAANAVNNGTFVIAAFIGATTVDVVNAAAVVPDANNGAISWVEHFAITPTGTGTGTITLTPSQNLPQDTRIRATFSVNDNCGNQALRVICFNTGPTGCP